MFLSRNYRLIVAPQKFDVLKTNMLVLRSSNLQGATVRPTVPRHKHSIVFIVHHKMFFRAPVQKSIGLVSNFLDESRESQKTDKNSLTTISIAGFLQPRLFTEKFSRTGTIHPRIFRGRALSIRAFSADGHYRICLPRNYRLIVARGNLMFLKQIFA